MTKNNTTSLVDVKYSLDELRDVWYFAMIQGATLWQYCQDTKRDLPEDFNLGIVKIFNHIDDIETLKTLLGSSQLACGLFDELYPNSKVLTVKNNTSKKPQVKKKSSKLTK